MDLQKTRGQGYVNKADVSGMYTGVKPVIQKY
jgi:hypothetical protein